MTGLECLKEEMAKRGCSKAQIESKTVAIVLDILAGTGTEFTKLHEDSKRMEERRKELDRREKQIDAKKEKVDEQVRSIVQQVEETKEYVKGFFEALEKCETKEARDKLKIAQTFRNSVGLPNCSSNTAYIEGLAKILAGGEVIYIEKIKYIDKDSPLVDEQLHFTQRI